MIESLRIFEIDPSLQVINHESKVYTDFEMDVDYFFKEHITNSISDINSKAARFRNDSSDIFEASHKSFSLETFEESSKEIAEILTNNMHQKVTNNFNFIVLNYHFSDAEVVDNGDGDRTTIVEKDTKILAIMKMETRDGVQLFEGDFKIRKDMLPDIGNQLQKCAFVYQTFIDNFAENSKGEMFHLKILDKQDKAISNYFINLMNSVVVADDEEMTKLAQLFIKRETKKFVKSDSNKSDIDNRMNVIMSRRGNVTIDGIVEELSEFMSDDRLEKAGYTIDGLTNHIFQLIRKRNPSSIRKFKATPVNADKLTIRNEDRSVWVSIEKGLIEDGIVKVDGSSSEGYSITIPKEAIE